jgi:quinol monooxygenase YgiN
MYGSVAHVKIKPGHWDAVIPLLEEWGRDRKPQLAGAVAAYCYRLDADPNELIIAAVFADKAAYFAQGDVPAQGEWFGRLNEHFAGEAQWNDGEIVTVG